MQFTKNATKVGRLISPYSSIPMRSRYSVSVNLFAAKKTSILSAIAIIHTMLVLSGHRHRASSCLFEGAIVSINTVEAGCCDDEKSRDAIGFTGVRKSVSIAEIGKAGCEKKK